MAAKRKIGGRAEIAPLIEAFGLEAGPVGDRPPPGDRPGDEEKVAAETPASEAAKSPHASAEAMQPLLADVRFVLAIGGQKLDRLAEAELPKSAIAILIASTPPAPMTSA
jgi:hypothetical protein